MDPIYPKLITDALATVRYPGTGKNLVEAGMVADDIRIDGRSVSFSIEFEKPTDPFAASVRKAAETAIHTYVGGDVAVTVNAIFPKPAPKAAEPVLTGVKNIIGVSSGKGGVGKSTVAANLAVALAAEGYKVGLLDADIFGPSVPKMFGIEDEARYMHQVGDRNLIIPAERYGVKLISIGLLYDRDSAIVWRGGMASRALNQLIAECDWGELDYFLIDMPPGTSDIHLTLVQTLAMTGAIVVTTPQQVALADARKGIAMFRDDKVNVPILGLVENMAWFTPPAHPEERYFIFGRNGGAELAEELHTELLAQIPVVESICEAADSGTPIALAGTIASQAYFHLAHRVVEAVEVRNSTLPPTEKVEIKVK